MRLRVRAVAAFAPVLLLAGLLAQSAPAQGAQTSAATRSTTSAAKPPASPGKPKVGDRLTSPATVLPTGWQHSSDEAVAVAGDATGLHVLAASEASGYTWRSVTTLGDPSVSTSQWIGQACVTVSGRYAVVVYAPQQVTNMAGGQGVLARAAVVNLRTGATVELGGGFSIAYFDPGCGTGNQAVLTRGGWANDNSRTPLSTTLQVVDVTTGRISATVRASGQVTSAVPYAGQIAAAGGTGVEEITRTGQTRLLAVTPAVPYQLTPDASGGLGYQTVAGKQVRLWRLAGGQARPVASAAEGSVQLRQIGGRVWLVGPDASKIHGLPGQWRAVDAPVTAQPSTAGALAVAAAAPLPPASGKKERAPGTAQPVAISTELLGGSRPHESFDVPTTPAVKAAPAAPARSASPATVGSGSTPVSADRTCAIPIDDPQIQAYQPTFPQVEWAADQAVQGTLTDTRPAGLYGSALSSYTPQGMFSLPTIDGGGQLPAQVLLGVLTQESNLQQASMHVIQGQTSNPLTSFDWYGNWIDGETIDTGFVDWSNSDCGYGIAQVTSGMCLAEGQNSDSQCEYQAPLPYEQQLAIAVDYQANIAKGAQLLIRDWNQLWTDNIKPDGDTVSYGVSSSANLIDNWYMALWAYNSGLEPATSKYGNTTGCMPSSSCTDGNPANGGDWGLGYADNPINPAYPPDRPTFPGSSPAGHPAPGGAAYSTSWDMSHPQYWPYQEKVLAWAYDSITLWDYSKGADVQAFAYAHGTYTPPPYKLFCTSANSCNAGSIDYTQATGPDACQLTGNYGDHCWWHVEPDSSSWPITAPIDTCNNCGTTVITYASGAADPASESIASQFRPTCTESPLPSSAVIVGDGGQAALGCPGQDWTSAGSMSWKFAADGNGNYSSKINFDQIGAGFGGHFWFGYTQPSNGASASSATPEAGYAEEAITGTWTPPGSVTGWTRVEAAIPSYGADAVNANYQVDPGGKRATRNVQIDQDANQGTNTWVDLGDFYLGSGAHVSLSNVTFGGTGVDIAWDAMAFVPVSDPQVNYVAMGDSYSSGEGNSPYFPDSNTSNDTCHRSMSDAYPMQVTLPGETEPIANQTADGFSFIACSGAETTGVAGAAVNPAGSPIPEYAANTNEDEYNRAGNTDWGYQQYQTPWTNPENVGLPEGLQAGNSALKDSTDLITFSIGGNDARFGDVIFGCLSASFITNDDCSASNYTLTRHSNGFEDPAPLEQFEPTVINYLQAHLLQTYLSINEAASSADIVVVGYPLLFAANPTAPCDSGSIAGKAAKLSVNAQDFLNQLGTDLNTAISGAVSQAQGDGVDIQFVNPTSAFAGHELCGSDPWFLPLSLTNQVSSYHPNPAGQQAYADLVNECLAGTLAC